MRTYYLSLILAAVSSGAVIDRIALVVGKTVFTQSEVDEEARLSEMEAGKPLDLSAAKRREAADRMVDQQLLRDEMAATAYQPPKIDSDALLREFRQQHFRTAALYRAGLTTYGITEDSLKQHLAWEVEVVQFTDQRFKPLIVPADPQSAERSTAPATPDDPMADWLKQQRAATRIVFTREAYQ